MPSDVIQWFPGHMAKTRRLMQECLSSVDLSIEILDARIPLSSRNPEIKKILGNKPILTLLSKASMADPRATEAWVAYFKAQGMLALPYDAITGEGTNALLPAIRTLLAEKLLHLVHQGSGSFGCARKERGIARIGGIVGLNKVADVDLVLPFAGPKAVPVLVFHINPPFGRRLSCRNRQYSQTVRPDGRHNRLNHSLAVLRGSVSHVLTI